MKLKAVCLAAIFVVFLFLVVLPITVNADVIYQQSADGSLPGAAYYNNYGNTSGISVDGTGYLWLGSMGSNWLNEVIVTVNLVGYTNGQLQFEQYTGDAESPENMPSSFSGHYNGDGVAISTDGTNWTTLINATQLAEELNSASLPSGSSLMIKFQQYNLVPQEYDIGGRFIGVVVITGTKITATVPNVVGMTQSAAQSAIVAAGLTVGTVSTAYSSTVPAGIVISQSPTAGSVGSSVSIVVSMGPSATVPNVVGLVQSAAQSAIISANLVVGTVTSFYSETVAAGNVISQSPVSGTTVGVGTAVNIKISLGPSPTGTYSGGNGTQANPYKIATVADFQELSSIPTDWNKSFVLTADINLAGLTFTQAPIAPDTSTSSGFQGTTFTGVFDGDGYTISNLTITASAKDYLGLFGCVSGGQIRNLGVENVNITGHSSVGGLVGDNSSSIISCYATGSVSGTGYYVGGLVGQHSSGTLTSCYSTGSVSGTGSYVGGLVGNNSRSLISCYATGSVSGTTYVGGLVGQNGYYDAYSDIAICYATGAVTGSSYVGGLVGLNQTNYGGGYGTATSCYATGLVSGTGSYVGGLVGQSLRWVIGIPDPGSSFSIPSPDLVQNSFWDTQTSGRTSSSGGTGKTMAQMKTLSTFTSAGWDFTNETAKGSNDFWRMCANGVDYPRLSWQSTDGDLACPNGVNIEDLAVFIPRWLSASCTSANNFCGGADINADGKVGLADYTIFADNWLAGM